MAGKGDSGAAEAPVPASDVDADDNDGGYENPEEVLDGFLKGGHLPSTSRPRVRLAGKQVPPAATVYHRLDKDDDDDDDDDFVARQG